MCCSPQCLKCGAITWLLWSELRASVQFLLCVWMEEASSGKLRAFNIPYSSIQTHSVADDFMVNYFRVWSLCVSVKQIKITNGRRCYSQMTVRGVMGNNTNSGAGFNGGAQVYIETLLASNPYCLESLMKATPPPPPSLPSFSPFQTSLFKENKTEQTKSKLSRLTSFFFSFFLFLHTQRKSE